MNYKRGENGVLTKRKDLRNPFFKRNKINFKRVSFYISIAALVGGVSYGLWLLLPDFKVVVNDPYGVFEEGEVSALQEIFNTDIDQYNIIRRPDKKWYDSKVGEIDVKITNISEKITKDIISIERYSKLYYLNKMGEWKLVNRVTGSEFALEDDTDISNHINNGSVVLYPIIELVDGFDRKISDDLILNIFEIHAELESTEDRQALIFRIFDNHSTVKISLRNGQELVLSEESFNDIDRILDLIKDMEDVSSVDARFPGRIYTR